MSRKRSVILAASATAAALVTSAASAQVIENFDDFAPTQKFAAWTIPAPYTVITSTATGWETFSDWQFPSAYGSCYYEIYPTIVNCGTDNDLQLMFTVNNDSAEVPAGYTQGVGPLVDLDDGEGDEWQYSFGFGYNPGIYIVDVPFNAPYSMPMTAAPPTPGGFDFTQIEGFNLEADPGTNKSYDMTWQNLAGVFTLNWNNTGATAPADGATWDGVNNNWNNNTAAQTYSDGDQVQFNDNNNGHYNVTLNSTVSPGAILVNNSNGNYEITSSTTTVSGTPTGLIVDTGFFYKTGSGALVLGTGLTANEFIINEGLVQLQSDATAGTGNATSNINISSLVITGNGVMDINNNHLIIDYTSSDPIAAIRAYLLSGFNNGAWNGTGIISSAAATQNATGGAKYGVGWADGADHVVVGLSSGQIELKYTLLGDANLDGTVNGSDFSILAANFGLGTTNWDQGNFLYGTSVNGSDFSALAANFGQGDSGAAVTPADVAALDAFAVANGLPLPTIGAVPEPASLALLGFAGIGMLSRRRKSR
jgi:hypothetical protein